MVTVAADIQISADVSNAVSAVGALGRALDALASKNLSGKALTSFSNQVERDLGKLAAKMVNVNGLMKEQSNSFRDFMNGSVGKSGNSFGKGLTQAMKQSRREAQDLADDLQKSLTTVEKTRATALGASQVANARSRDGALRDPYTKQYLPTEYLRDGLASQYEKLIQLRKQDRQISAQTQAGMMLENNLSSKFVDRQSELLRIRQRSATQQRLEAAFSSRFYGVADQNATRMQRLANVMRQIPPVTWNEKMKSAGSAIGNMSNSTRYAMYDVSMSAGIAGTAILGMGVAATMAAISHERAFANVARTTQASAAGYAVLNRQLEEMSMSLPVTYEELTNIATAAGQLGIQASGVASFTKTVAMLSATTNLTSEAAGVALARFRTFFSEVSGGDQSLAVTDSTMSNLASSILKVGVNSIATETGIVNVAVQIASMADYAGFTANQVIGLAGALSSIGVAPELSRGTITRTFSLIGNAVSTNGVQLQKFAKLAGVSAREFHDAWGSGDFAGVFTKMMQGISKYGGDANLMLMELGFNSVRDRPLLLRLAGAANEAGEAGGLLAQTMEDAYVGWVQNAELALQYSKISNTTSARIQVLAQSFEQLFATMGKQTGGFVGEAAEGLTNFVKGLEALSRTDGGQAFGSIAVQMAAVVGIMLLVVSVGARVIASMQGIGVAFTAMTNTALTGMTRISMGFKVLALSGGIITMIGAIAGLVAGFVAFDKGARDAKRGLQDFDALAAAMASDAANGETNMLRLQKATDGTGLSASKARQMAADMTAALYGSADAAGVSASALDKAGDSAKSMSFAFGDAANSIYNSALMQSEDFQKLFDLGGKRGFLELSDFKLLEESGFNPVNIDWDAVKKESLREGGDTYKEIIRQMKEMTGWDMQITTGSGSDGPAEAQALAWAREMADVVPTVATEVLAAQKSMVVLQQQSKNAFRDMSSGAISATEALAQMDEATQKTVEAYAGGLGKFTDMSKLIGLTQQRVEAEKATGKEAQEAAKKFENSWSEAYGGAEFSLNDYLKTFERAGREQRNFAENLQILGSAGVGSDILNDLANMGPEANRLVQAMVADLNATGGEGLNKFEELWGQTGYDSMVRFAVQAQMGQNVINQIMATGGAKALREFNDKLASGLGVDQALSALQRDIDGKPLTIRTNPTKPKNLTWAQRKLWEAQNTLSIAAKVRISSISGGKAVRVSSTGGGKSVTITPGMATGGHVVGPGTGTSDSIPTNLSNGEFVFTAKATRAIGVSNLYAMMNSAQGGRKAPRGGGYANGGHVTGRGGTGEVIAHLSPEDRALLRGMQPYVTIDGREIANANRNADRTSTRRGV